MMFLLFVLMIVFRVNVGVQVQIPVGPTVTGVEGTWSSTVNVILVVGLSQIVVFGMFFGFLGVGLAEGACRLKKWLKR
ncbi:MAG: hypothetical protein LBQ98_00995 [Nitrososphaerota archaeon]|jgi:hypothetical protein|nr:hypothetical protein [Nitrososphaerota archaeon]